MINSIAEAMAARPLPMCNFHHEVCLRVAAVAGLDVERTAIAGLNFLHRSGPESMDDYVGSMVVAAENAWNLAKSEVEAFIRWLVRTDMRAATSPWTMHEGDPVLEAHFRNGGSQQPNLSRALLYLCPTRPTLRVGSELPSFWSKLDSDTVVHPDRIVIERPWSSSLGWRQLHPCTQDIASRIVLQRSWHGAGDAARFLSDVGFSLQPAAITRPA